MKQLIRTYQQERTYQNCFILLTEGASGGMQGEPDYITTCTARSAEDVASICWWEEGGSHSMFNLVFSNIYSYLQCLLHGRKYSAKSNFKTHFWYVPK